MQQAGVWQATVPVYSGTAYIATCTRTSDGASRLGGRLRLLLLVLVRLLLRGLAIEQRGELRRKLGLVVRLLIETPGLVVRLLLMPVSRPSGVGLMQRGLLARLQVVLLRLRGSERSGRGSGSVVR